MGQLIKLFLVMLILISSSNIVLAEDSAENPENYTVYDMFSKEEINTWNRELEYHAYHDPVVGDWKSAGSELTAVNTVRNDEFIETGSWTWRDGVICITSTCTTGQWDHGHAGIVAVAPYYDSTCEANPGTGVSTVVGAW